MTGEVKLQRLKQTNKYFLCYKHLNTFDHPYYMHQCFWNRQSWGGGGEHEAPHHNCVVIAPMIMKFGTGVKLDVCYTMVTKEIVTSYCHVIMMS